MQSTFHGLETARRGMMTQQYALRTVGHNIANANTPGYSRQRVNFEQSEPYPAVGMNRPRIPGHLGTGVQAGSVQRIREQFLDIQYRNEMNKVGYWNGRYTSYSKMEDVLIETKDQGLNYQINLFWTSIQDLILDPEDSGARAVVRERGKFISETFNYYHNSLTEIKNDYKSEIEDAQEQIKYILDSIEQINEQIRRTEPHGYVPNDLYDRQDMLLDQLSQFVNIKVTREQSGGKPNPVAEGPVTVTLVDEVGNPYTRSAVDENGDPIQVPVKLIDGKPGGQSPLKVDIKFHADGYVEGFTFSDGAETDPIEVEIPLNAMPRGELKALIEAYGYDSGERDGNGDPIIKGIYPKMLNELNLVAEKFVTEFNNLHKLGFTLPDKDGNIKNGGDFFVIANGKDPAAGIQISEEVLESLDNIAAAGVNVDALTEDAKAQYDQLMAESPKNYEALHELLNDDNSFKPGVSKAYAGDASNARLLAGLKDMLIDFNGDTASISSYYQGVIGEMAVAAQESFGKLASSEAILNTVEFNRLSTSGVLLDEEFTMLIQFQHAYNAAARNITMIDEMLDRIINGMGVVGR